MKPEFRIRRCKGNPNAWLLCRLRPDGSESDSFGSYTTALTLDMLIAKADLPPGTHVETVL
jgi:hypothetical protein